MNTKTFNTGNPIKKIALLGILMLLAMTTNSVIAQSAERAVTGLVTDETGPLEGATVYLDGTSIATSTNEEGKFTFPKLLKENDVLVVTHIGYKDQRVIIGADVSFVEIALTDYDIIIVGALKIGTNKVPKSVQN